MSSSFFTLVILSFLSTVQAGPCDIYAAGGTPCVAAHSTTRILSSSYSGPLYQVTRDDGTTADISASSSGIADSSIQDTFCASTGCVISIIYDQSGQGNDLRQAPKGSFSGGGPGGIDLLANATAAPVYLKGNKVYGVYTEPGMGYRNNEAKGTATGDDPEGMYAIFDGTHYNDGCCYDYGNAEISSTDTGNTHMEAIYFGNGRGYGVGDGDGPWVMADLENGLFAGATSPNNNNPSITYEFVTAMLKGNNNNTWAIRGGDSTQGNVATFWDGPRPDGYSPMNKEGAIILGIGGDNSNGARGTFFEGVMTTGYPSAAIEDEVQADIVAAGYGKTASDNQNPPPPEPSPTTTSDSAAPTTTDESTSTTSSEGSEPTDGTGSGGSGEGDGGDNSGDNSGDDGGDDGDDECDA